MKKSLVPNNSLFKICISAAAAFYIVFHGRKVNLLESLQTPIFYIALTVSFLVALLMVNIIDYAHRWLEERHDWLQESFKRSVAQFVLCVLLPLLVDFGLLSIYFYLLGTNIFESGFLKHDFPVIVLFILVVNFYYITVSLFAEKEMTATLIDSRLNQDNDTDVIRADEQTGEVTVDKYVLLLEILCPELQDENFNLKDDVLYFFRNSKHVLLVTSDGQEYPVNGNLSFLIDQFSEGEFIQINRSIIINSKIIKSYTGGVKRNTLNLQFVDEHKEIFMNDLEGRFDVTKNYISNITRLF